MSESSVTPGNESGSPISKETPAPIAKRAPFEGAKKRVNALLARIKGARSNGKSGMGELTPITLTQVEQHQAFKQERSSIEGTLELADRIQDRLLANKDLRIQLLSNPYHPKAAELFERAFGQPLTPDAIRALILAEPPEEYDRKFSQLSLPKKEEALYEQIDTSADMTVRLGKHVEERGDIFFGMTNEQIYLELSQMAFGEQSRDTINRKFSQSQRRGFRLSIVNFVQDMRKLEPYGEQFTTDIKGSLQRYDITSKAIQHLSETTVEVTPLGIVISLDTEDYLLVTNEKSDHDRRSSGQTLHSDTLPPELKGRVILIDRGTSQEPKEVKEVQGTRKHELLHSAYASFFERQNRYDTDTSLKDASSYKDYTDLAGAIRLQMLDTASNEVISYNSTYSYFSQDIDQLGGSPYSQRIDQLRRKLSDESNTLSSDQKETVYQLYEQQRIAYMEQVAEYQWVAHQLFSAARSGERGLTEAKVQALLQNTRSDRIARLGNYFGVAPESVHATYIAARSTALDSFSEDMNTLVTSQDGQTPQGETPDALNKTIGFERFNEVMALYPTEIIPTLLQVITGINDGYYVQEAMDTLSTIIQTQARNISNQTIAEVKVAIRNMNEKRAGDEFKGARNKYTELNRILYTLTPKMMVYGADESLLPDFRGGDVLRAKIKSVVGEKPEYQSYTLVQEAALAELLTPEELMSKHVIIYDERPEAIPVLATILGKVSQINTSANDVYIMNGLGLIEKLGSYYSRLLPDQRSALERVMDIIERWDPPDTPESLRDYYKTSNAAKIAAIRERLNK